MSDSSGWSFRAHRARATPIPRVIEAVQGCESLQLFDTVSGALTVGGTVAGVVARRLAMGDQPALPSDSDVNIDHVEKAPAWLEQLQGYVETYCIGEMTGIRAGLSTAGLDISDVDMNLNGDATYFGGFYSAFGIQAKHDAVFDAINRSLRDFAEHLGKAADATKKIAQNYRTTEAQNAASMTDIQRLLDAGVYTPKDPDAVANRNRPDDPPPDQPRVLAPGRLGDGPPSRPSGPATA
jgi:hypothetical protein